MKILKVGSDQTNNIVVNDPKVEPLMHCQIIQNDNGEIALINCTDKETYVNGAHVEKGAQIPLYKNDLVRVGDTILHWEQYFAGHTTVYPNVDQNQFSHRTSEYREIPPKPDNYLVWAILSTIFCCLPLGIVSIVYASKVDRLWDEKDYDNAIHAAKLAKTWFWWSFGIGLGVMVISWILTFTVFGFALTDVFSEYI